MSEPTPLLRDLRALIAAEGPIGVERYLALCLGHPVHGYYRTRDPLGAAGDFVTAPEISQMFGELLGLWAAGVWDAMGRPAPCRLVELGPGRGTLMADATRAIRAALPAAAGALDVHLVETSPVLAARQRERLSGADATWKTTWHEDVADVPPGPAIVLANEFFDALPVRQYALTERGWCERLVGLGPEGDPSPGLVFGLAAEPEARLGAAIPRNAAPGAVLEWPRAGLELVRALAARLVAEGGALLAIDYGHDRTGLGDTLQAVSGHAPVDPLARPGEADLTTHVDFGALGRAAAEAGAAVHGPVAQGDFLEALGLSARAARLSRDASAEAAAGVEAARRRLVDPSPRGMGRLFRVLGIAAPGLALPGLPQKAPPA